MGTRRAAVPHACGNRPGVLTAQHRSGFTIKSLFRITAPSSAPACRAAQLDGVLLLDKPLGPVQQRRTDLREALYLAKKAGHTGTLDPLATGLLPLVFRRGHQVFARSARGRQDLGRPCVSAFARRPATPKASRSTRAR